ncbi:MAG: hypothetical protein ABWY02_15095 [Telluria sp.]
MRLPFPVRRLFAVAAISLGIASPSIAQSGAPDPMLSRDKLMVVLREAMGANKPDEGLKPTGKLRARMPDGREIEVEMAHYELIGDMQVRFVFDGAQSMRNATPEDLARFGLTAGEALRVAVGNVKRVYGNPRSLPWTGGVMQVKGKSPDLDSSYFLDRAFWTELGSRHPAGVVVAVPKRGGLLYVPAADVEAVNGLRKGIASLYSSSGSLRVSSALYLFKDGKWSVFQAPIK